MDLLPAENTGWTMIDQNPLASDIMKESRVPNWDLIHRIQGIVSFERPRRGWKLTSNGFQVTLL